MINKFRLWLRKLLGIDELERILKHDVKVMRSLLEASNRRCDKIDHNIKDICNSAVMGVDLCYRDSSAIIIIKYSRLTNGFTIIEDSQCKFESYRQVVGYLRKLTHTHGVNIACFDEPKSDYPLSRKILPDRSLIDYYTQRNEGD